MNQEYVFDLGDYHRAVSTQNPEAQRWFDRGLVWGYAYNHEEAINCFEKAIALDPQCAMAHWGVSYAAGPNYNKPWEAFTEEDSRLSLKRAKEAQARADAHGKGASSVEQALIGALAERYAIESPEEDGNRCNDAYANAMRKVYAQYPDDLDVATLFVEALINRTPWQLWDIAKGVPNTDANTLEAIQVAEQAMQQPGGDSHPGLLHMYIHIMEMSPYPEKAQDVGDKLRNLVPDAGHLLHMPTHIDVLCGDYDKVVHSNHNAILADNKFLQKEGPVNFYSLYRCHNFHFKLYGAMFLGKFAPAIEAADQMIASLPEELLRMETPPMADWLEGFVPMKLHVMIRFGKWQEIIDYPLPQDQALFCVTTAMIHYAKTVAYAASGDVENALRERPLFYDAVQLVPDTRYVFNNSCVDILQVAAAMLEGELAYRQGDYDTAFDHLRTSVSLDDNLPYDEPWAWMQPTRHALGALLLEQNKMDEAEAVYRADLGLDETLPRACRHPDNVWSLHGLHEVLLRKGKSEEAKSIKPKLDIAIRKADVPIKASCYCRTTH